MFNSLKHCNFFLFRLPYKNNVLCNQLNLVTVVACHPKIIILMCQLSGTHRVMSGNFFSHICAPLYLTTKSAVSSQSIAQDVHSMYQVNLRGHNYYNHANFTSNGISSDRLSLQVYHKVLPQLRSSLYNYYFQKSTFIDSECTNQCLTISCLSARHFWSCWLNPAAAECSVLMKVGRSETIRK